MCSVCSVTLVIGTEVEPSVIYFVSKCRDPSPLPEVPLCGHCFYDPVENTLKLNAKDRITSSIALEHSFNAMNQLMNINGIYNCCVQVLLCKCSCQTMFGCA